MITLGTKIRIVEMIGEPNYTGKIGVIERIDDMGHLHGTWGGLSIVPGDSFEIWDEVWHCWR